MWKNKLKEFFSIQLKGLQFQEKENTMTHFNMKNPPRTNMINSLVYRFKTYGRLTDHLQSCHSKSACTEAVAKAVFCLMSQSFMSHPVHLACYIWQLYFFKCTKKSIKKPTWKGEIKSCLALLASIWALSWFKENCFKMICSFTSIYIYEDSRKT